MSHTLKPDTQHATAQVDAAEHATSLEAHRAFLHRVARLQLGCDEDARDAVQETLVAALCGYDRWSASVPLRAWLLGILRHKIIDTIRQRARFVHLDPEDLQAADPDDFEDLFDHDDRWRPEAVAHGGCPHDAAVRRQLMEVVEFCISRLPDPAAKVFLMREFLGMEFTEIAGTLELAPGHLRVLLHRARMRLRDCVSRGWGSHDALQ